MPKIKPVEGKREKISKAQQYTMLEVLGASLVLGACIVISVFLIKYIKFNTQIIAAKNDAIAEYDETIRNVGICVDKDKNGRLSAQELEDCDPNKVTLNEVTGSLRYNVLAMMAQNADLESVARLRNENCYDENGNRINFSRLYEMATTDVERQQYMQQSKICSALRVIPDALPAQQNTEALMASLNQIFILAKWEPERLAPRDDIVATEIEGVGTIPVQLRVEGSNDMVVEILDRIEKSVREFNVSTATIEWVTAGLSLNAAMNSYYLDDAKALEETETLYASAKARRTNK